MTLNLRMAWRNLWRHKRRTWLTVTAMIFSNVLLVFMISLQFGSYEMMIVNTLQTFSGHLQVQAAGYQDNPRLRTSIPAIESLAQALQQTLRETLPGARAAPRAAAFALASSERRSFAIQLVGVQPSAEPGVSTLPGLVTSGRYLRDGGDPEIVIGTVMSRNLKAGVGDEITLLGAGRDGSFAAGVVTVVGVFDSGSADMDRGIAEVPLDWFQDAFAMADHGNTIAIAVERLADVPPAVRVAAAMASARGDEAAPLLVLDWNDLYPGLRQAIQADLFSGWFMYGVLIFLVAFSVLNTQLMSVLERTREFGVISALGIRPRKLAALVMLETAQMALIGLGVGLLLGWLVAQYFNLHGFSYPGMEEIAERYNLPGEMYPRVTFGTLLLGPSVVFAFCLLAAIYPALRLFRLRPVEAMRAA
ncbi:MAG: FtsX-like permease family protein [Xanthomonadales bacterium]|jgi:ABC-type lipoprotein release transport system permease subunit|nr:FtsX-like permease family protein [Xanthomonadales bacterium]